MTTHSPQPLDITNVSARSILDSRGYPTIEVGVGLADGYVARASAPAGASTGEFEAVELRDGGTRSSGRGVSEAVKAVEGELAELLTGRPWSSMREADNAMRALDGTGNEARLGANSIVALSMAVSRAFAHAADIPLHQWIAHEAGSAERLPVPHFNVLNGGAHAANELDFQEFMIAPVGATSFHDALDCGAAVYHALSANIRTRYHSTGLGDEGGFAPPISSPEEALDLLVAAISAAGCTPGVDPSGTNTVAIALDPAANGFRLANGYRLKGKEVSAETLINYYVELIDGYPIWSIEDGFAEDDRESWHTFFELVGDRIQLVGDDIYVTDAERISRGAEERLSNSTLIKPNQIGTVTGTLEAIAAARAHHMTSMVSHRSGETLDTFIADLVVGTGVGQIKSGAPARGERVAKYNRLARIEADHPELPFGLV